MKISKYERKLKKEYKDTFNSEKKRFYLKPSYILCALLIILGLFLIGEHIGVEIYNTQLNKRFNDYITDTSYVEIDNKEQYKKLTTKDIYSKRTSILSNILSFELISCGSGNDLVEAPTTDFDAEESGTSIATNVQVLGIDEADVSKCDGTYIYALINNNLCIYNLSGNLVTYVTSYAKEIYVYENKVITLSENDCYIYQFNHQDLRKVINYNYENYINSRLRSGHLYLVYSEKSKDNNIEYGNCYYYGVYNSNYVYSIIDYNLDTDEINSVQALSGYGLVLYMSYDNFYLAISEFINGISLTSVMMFDKKLNPVGVMKVHGTVLNQFSMDEYDSTFRIVTTDTQQEAERLNAISIFDINSLEQIGFFNEGIGIGRQVVKSVTYDKNKCFVVTYQNTDPLYEIDCSDPKNIFIVSALEAPGYSNYLYKFSINGSNYILGLGYTDSRYNTKISIYLNDEGKTPQIGSDFIIGDSRYYDQVDYLTYSHNVYMFTNHKALFLYCDDTFLYLGALVDDFEYVIFRIDVNNEKNPVTVYKKIANEHSYDVRSYLIDNVLYVVTMDGIVIEEW